MKTRNTTLSSMESCLTEAKNTFEQYWGENCPDEISNDQMWDIIDNAIIKLNNISQDDVEEDFISEIKKTPLHSVMYDLVENVPDRAYTGILVIVEDVDKGKSLIIDGNHRYNTFLAHCPNQLVYYVVIDASLP